MNTELPNTVSLEEAVRRHPIEIVKNYDNSSLISSIDNILDSGVDRIILKISNKTGKVEVDENCYKSIVCSNVKVGKLKNKGNYATKSEARSCIETSYWHFPCPDYKYENIKRNLEKAIFSVANIDAEVKSFNTGIVEYD